jgi:hypothetical protein
MKSKAPILGAFFYFFLMALAFFFMRFFTSKTYNCEKKDKKYGKVNPKLEACRDDSADFRCYRRLILSIANVGAAVIDPVYVAMVQCFHSL